MSAPVVVSAGVASLAFATTGGWLVYSSQIDRQGQSRGHGPSGRGLVRARPWAPERRAGRAWRSGSRSGSGEVPTAELTAAVAVVAIAGGVLGWLLFGGLVPALFAAAFAGSFPVAGSRARSRARLEAALEEWPRLLEEVRLRTGSLGRSVPQALFEAAQRAPKEWRPVFDAAERGWLLTVDFGRTVHIIKQGLADPTADAVCETLLMAHEIGGTDLDAKLADLIEDRVLDVQSRRDAASRLAGVRFARRFVLLVPLGMAVAGLTIGSGRQAYQTPGGQIAVVLALTAVAVCWWWAGRLMRIPGPPRVFS